MVAIHSLIGIGEALITGGIVAYVLAQRPDLIVTNAIETRRGVIGGVGRVTAAGIVLALCVGAFLAPFASQRSEDPGRLPAETEPSSHS